MGLTGGPGAAYGVHVLRTLRALDADAHLVMCSCAVRAVREQTGLEPDAVRDLAGHTYDEWNQAARISSGSYLTVGMVVAPCSTRSLASITYGYANNLIHRAADVTLKEGRPLAVLVADPLLGPVDLDNVDRLGSVPGVTVIRMPPAPDAATLDGAISALLDVVGLPANARALPP
ncbi:MAG: UbiX family flavin prenyltransferase [Candidatus Velamenicoccus archaeovorus]